jgi:hypothetical protein
VLLIGLLGSAERRGPAFLVPAMNLWPVSVLTSTELLPLGEFGNVNRRVIAVEIIFAQLAFVPNCCPPDIGEETWLRHSKR